MRKSVLDELLDHPVKVYLAAAGAGAGMQKHLWEIPGASKFLIGASLPYAKEQMTRFIGYEPEKFVGQQTAIDMAIRSYLFASSGGDPSLTPIGLGLTASVATVKEHRGRHVICCAAITKTGVIYAEEEIPKGSGRDKRGGDGAYADAVGLEVLLRAAGIRHKMPLSNHTHIIDADEAARQAFFAHPFFTRDGQRHPANHALGRTLFPGAFNPPHKGHFYSAGQDVVFQITANPPKDVASHVQHKPSLSLVDMLDRYLHLEGLRDVLFLEEGSTYLEKARLYPGSAFVIGSDVVMRILDPKWGHEVEPMLEEFVSLNTRFEVGQKGDIKVPDVLALVPEPYRRLFSELPASPYPELSSRDIRAPKTPG